MPLTDDARTRTGLTVRHVGGPTALLTYGGVRLLTDPTFDEPGSYRLPHSSLVKLRGPAAQPDELGPLDGVLLSHDQHPDNLDRSGRALIQELVDAGAPVLSTTAAAQRIPGVTGLAPGQRTAVATAAGEVTVTAVAAEHGHGQTATLLGPVIGFILEATGLAPVYVSGDNASVEVVHAIAEAFPEIGAAVLFCGAARSATAPGPYTLTAADAVDVARILAPAVIVPVHTEGWAHFSEGPDSLVLEFERAGLRNRLQPPEAGVTVSV